MKKLVKIEVILQQSDRYQGWLYLRDQVIKFDSEGFFYVADLDLSTEEERVVRDGFAKDGWRSTLSAEDIEDVISNLTEQLDSDPTLDQKLAALNFFYQNDAFIELT